MSKNKNYYLIILLLFIFTLIIKINFLSGVIPGQDQTSYIYWLQSIFNSQHFFPEFNEKGLMHSLQVDDKSFLHNLLKPIYSSTTNIFTIISLLYFSIGSLIIDASVKTQVVLSIIINNISILAISLFFIKLGKENKEFIKLSILIFIFLQLNSFFYGFSTHGTHNVGIFFLIINLVYLEKYLKQVSINEITLLKRLSYFTIQGLAFYSMYTNVFLILSCSLIGIFFLDKKINFKLKELTIYLCSSAILFIPALLVFIFTLDNIENDQGFILWGKWAFSYVEGASSFELSSYLKTNLIKWYLFNSQIFGFIIFPLSLIGLIILKKKYNVNIFLYLFISHFLISFLMAGFNYAQSRTSAYLMPVCSIGISVLIYQLYSYFILNKKNNLNYFQKISILIIFFVILFEIILNTNKIFNPALIKTDWSVKYTNKNNKYKNLNKILNEYIENDALIITDTNSSRIILSSLNYPNKNLNYFVGLDSIKIHKNQFKLKLISTELINPNYDLVLFLSSKHNSDNKKKLKNILCQNDKILCDLEFLNFNLKNFKDTNFEIYRLIIK